MRFAICFRMPRRRGASVAKPADQSRPRQGEAPQAPEVTPRQGEAPQAPEVTPPKTTTRRKPKAQRAQATMSASASPPAATSPPDLAQVLQEVRALSAEVASIKAKLEATPSTQTGASHIDQALVQDTVHGPQIEHMAEAAISTDPPTLDPAGLMSILAADTSMDKPPPEAELLSGGSTQQTVGLDTFVPLKVREAIWQEKYVELAVLLPSYQKDNYFQFKEHSGTLCLAATKPTKKLSINEWVTAFASFMTVYLQKFPSASTALVKYMEIVRGISLRGGTSANMTSRSAACGRALWCHGTLSTLNCICR